MKEDVYKSLEIALMNAETPKNLLPKGISGIKHYIKNGGNETVVQFENDIDIALFKKLASESGYSCIPMDEGSQLPCDVYVFSRCKGKKILEIVDVSIGKYIQIYDRSEASKIIAKYLGIKNGLQLIQISS